MIKIGDKIETWGDSIYQVTCLNPPAWRWIGCKARPNVDSHSAEMMFQMNWILDNLEKGNYKIIGDNQLVMY